MPEVTNTRREKLAYLARHPWALFWHPHEGLWNSFLTKAHRGSLNHIMIWADTTIRCVSAYLKPSASSSTQKKARLVFVDVGLHREALQSLRMVDWFADDWPMLILGYEAHPDFASEARAHIEAASDGKPSIEVRVITCALVGPDSQDDFINLHLDGGSGKGNSLFPERGLQSIQVPTARLSEQLRENGVDFLKDIVILRMNVEGAELFVIEDLAAAGFCRKIDGYYGMWNDLFKISPAKDEPFRKLCRTHNIKPFPFNDRDLESPQGTDTKLKWREWAIMTHITKAITARNAEMTQK